MNKFMHVHSHTHSRMLARYYVHSNVALKHYHVILLSASTSGYSTAELHYANLQLQ